MSHFMSSENCAFLTFTGSTSLCQCHDQVCLTAEEGGNWSTSITSAAGFAWNGSWTSEMTGT